MEPDTFILELPSWLLKTIDSGLQNLVYREASPAINEINRQIMLQLQARKNMPTGLSSSSPDVSGTGEGTGT